MPTHATSNAAHFSPNAKTSTLTAVFIGGTSGIGEAMARSFAQYTNGKAHIAIVGRNREAGERILSELPKPDDPKETYSRLFIQCDVSLMRNIPPVVEQLAAALPKINYLILSTGFLDFSERKETPEGLEYRLAVSYYSRWFFTKELLGLVENAKRAGEPGAVMSVLAAGYGGEIDQEDWEIKNQYTTLKAIFGAATYNDLMVEAFADRHPTVPFVHAHPGMVRTPIFRNSPSFIWNFLGVLVHTVGRLFTISAEESSEEMWNIVAGVDNARGSYRMDPKGKNLEKSVKYFGTEEKREGLWQHTDSVILRSLKVQV